MGGSDGAMGASAEISSASALVLVSDGSVLRWSSDETESDASSGSVSGKSNVLMGSVSRRRSSGGGGEGIWRSSSSL